MSARHRLSAATAMVTMCVITMSGCVGPTGASSSAGEDNGESDSGTGQGLDAWVGVGKPAPNGPDGAGTGDGNPAALLPACTWPSSLDPADASSGQCRAARAVLSCSSANGSGEGCLSDDPTQCPTTGLICVSCGPFTCHDQCEPSEYGLVCGGIGPSVSAAQPPSDCRSVGVTPGGTAFYCCPCGADDGGPETTDYGPIDSAPTPNADAFVAAYVGPASDADARCGFSSDQAFVQIGSPTVPAPNTVLDGGSQAGNPVNVTCKVDASGDGFDILLTAGVDGFGGGEFSVSGHITAEGSSEGTSDGGTGVFGFFSNALYGSFSASSCTIALTYDGSPVPAAGGGIAPGRIWGHIDCPDALDTLVETADGGVTTSTCNGHADFLFEDCQ
jgi:hypothetical protein